MFGFVSFFRVEETFGRRVFPLILGGNFVSLSPPAFCFSSIFCPRFCDRDDSTRDLEVDTGNGIRRNFRPARHFREASFFIIIPHNLVFSFNSHATISVIVIRNRMCSSMFTCKMDRLRNELTKKNNQQVVA